MTDIEAIRKRHAKLDWAINTNEPVDLLTQCAILHQDRAALLALLSTQGAVTPDEDDIANLEFARDTLRLFIGTHASKMVTLKSAASTAAWRLTATLEHLRKPQGGK